MLDKEKINEALKVAIEITEMPDSREVSFEYFGVTKSIALYFYPNGINEGDLIIFTAYGNTERFEKFFREQGVYKTEFYDSFDEMLNAVRKERI